MGMAMGLRYSTFTCLHMIATHCGDGSVMVELRHGVLIDVIASAVGAKPVANSMLLAAGSIAQQSTLLGSLYPCERRPHSLSTSSAGIGFGV